MFANELKLINGFGLSATPRLAAKFGFEPALVRRLSGKPATVGAGILVPGMNPGGGPTDRGSTSSWFVFPLCRKLRSSSSTVSALLMGGRSNLWAVTGCSG